MLPTFGVIECYRGDGLSRTLTVTTNGVARDITGWTITFTAKVNDTDLDADAVVSATATITNGPGGLAALTLTATDTDLDPGVYAADLEFRPPAGEPMTIKGTLRIVQDVRRG